MDQIIKGIAGVFSSDYLSLTLKIILLCLGGLGVIFGSIFWNRIMVSAARREEEAKQIADKGKVIDDNKKQNNEAQKDSSAVDNFLKGGGK